MARTEMTGIGMAGTGTAGTGVAGTGKAGTVDEFCDAIGGTSKIAIVGEGRRTVKMGTE